MTETKRLVNRHGEIEVGTTVYFEVENANVNYWPSPGILRHDGNVFFIETTHGRLDISVWLGAYLNTIQPVRRQPSNRCVMPPSVDK